MKTVRVILNVLFLFLSFSLAGGNAFAQVKALASGDLIVIERLTAKQIGNQPIEFAPSNPRAYPFRIRRASR
jgi:hypothetical protein